MKHTTLLLALGALSAPLSHASTPIPDAAQYTVMSNGVVIPSPETYYVAAADPSPTPIPNGWDGNKYYLNGKATTLDQNGNGLYNDGHVPYIGVLDPWNTTGVYSNGKLTFYTDDFGDIANGKGEWIGGILNWDFKGNGTGYDAFGNLVTFTNGLPSSYTGFDGSGRYYNNGTYDPDFGTVNNGWDGVVYFVDGTPAPSLSSSGTGIWGSGYYTNGQLYSNDYTQNGTSGYDSNVGIYFSEGKPTTLDQNGNGNTFGTFYTDGNPTTHYQNGYKSGWIYDASGNPIGYSTSLDTNGNGDGFTYFWENTHFTAGVPESYSGLLAGRYYANGYYDPNYVPNSTGWDGVAYFSAGQATTLDQNGTGIWSGQGYFYGDQVGTVYGTGMMFDKNGVWTSQSNGLPSTFTGSGGGVTYVKGAIDPAAGTVNNGWDGYGYFVNGTATSLDSNGTGVWNGQSYQNGQAYTSSFTQSIGTGYDSVNHTYYVNGSPTTLDQNGNGSWDGYFHNGGVATTTVGWNNFLYDKAGTPIGYAYPTPLDSTGSGTVMGISGTLYTWVNGVPTNYTGVISGVNYVNGVAQ